MRLKHFSDMYVKFGRQTRSHVVSMKVRKGEGVAFKSTSITARGGGGSFKNRKRIGEIGSCSVRLSN